MNKILNLMQDIFPSFTCYIDFSSNNHIKFSSNRMGNYKNKILNNSQLKTILIMNTMMKMMKMIIQINALLQMYMILI